MRNRLVKNLERVLLLVKLTPHFKLWLETEDGYVFGQGSFALLRGIQEKGNLKAAAEELHMSYRHAWGILKQIEETLGQPVVIAHRGGKVGGGGAELTGTGKELLETYLKFKSDLTKNFSNAKIVELPS
jgi:molybdate transport repressor ModE-like protein